MRSPGFVWILALFLVLPIATRAEIAVFDAGRIDAADGNVDGESSPRRTVTRVGEGEYEISYDVTDSLFLVSVGIRSASDFVVETTVVEGGRSDLVAVGRVMESTDALIRLRIRILDVAVAASPGSGLNADADFFYRVIVGNPSDSGAAGFDFSDLPPLAAGTVASSGLLVSGYGVRGLVPSAGRVADGHYRVGVSFTGIGASFLEGDSVDDYVLLLNLGSSATGDRNVRGKAESVADGDKVTFSVRIDDLQDSAASDTGIPVNQSFSFAIYSRHGMRQPLDKALISVDAPGGTIGLRHSAFPDSEISCVRNGTGRYRLKIRSETGAFGINPQSRYAPFVFVQGELTSSEFGDVALGTERVPEASVSLESSDTLAIDVSINDLAESGQAEGLPADQDFALLLMDAQPAAGVDLSISGRSQTLEHFHGTGIVNETGRQQIVRVRVPNEPPKRKFFLAVQNIGDVREEYRIPIRNPINPRLTFFRNSPQSSVRENITTRVTLGLPLPVGPLTGFLGTPVTPATIFDPGQRIVLFGEVSYLHGKERPSRDFKFRVLGNLDRSAAATDVNFLGVR